MEIDPDLSDSNATSVSALDMILKSMWKISIFLSDFVIDYVEEVKSYDESILPQDIFRIFLLNKLSLTHPLEEENGVSKLFLNILELLPRLNSHFEVNEAAKKICSRCRFAYSGEKRSYRIIINAHALRLFKSAFVDFTFETLLKVIRINVEMVCDKEGCGKQNYVDTMLTNLPSAFTIALEWENNETAKEIFETTSILATEIDISAIYQYQGDSAFTKYRLVSMVWSHEDRYNCVAYENNRWVRYFGSEIEVIGDWDGVLSIFIKLHIRPEILFFECAMPRDKMFSPHPPEDLSDDAEESVGKLKAICFSALDMILKSLWQINAFKSSREDESVTHEFLLNNLSLNHPLGENGVFDLFLNILEDRPDWLLRFEMFEVTKKICSTCKTDLEYPFERRLGLIINATSLREVKFAFEDFTFENIIKDIKMNLKMPCYKEGCGKESCAQRMIKKLPSVFTIALEWTKNETEKQIYDTTSVLATEIDICAIYQYEGDSTFTIYRLVSMVCSQGDRYNCVAYENNRWVRYFCSEIEVIGDWDGVLSIFRKLHIRPEIMFFEYAIPRDKMSSPNPPEHRSSKKTLKKEVAKQEKLRRRQEEAQARLKSSLDPEDDEFAENYGDVTLLEMQSIAVDNPGAGNWRTAIEGKKSYGFEELDDIDDESEVLVRGRVHVSRAISSTTVFLVLRQRGLTLQCIAKVSRETKVGRNLIKFVQRLPSEAVVDLFGVKTQPNKPLENTTQTIEVKVRKIYCLSRPSRILPFEIRNASACESDTKAVPVLQDTRLNNRVLELRTLANQAIFRLVCNTETAIRNFLVSKGFTGIHTPRLIKGSVEGGANVFNLKYHGDDACLAQSAQLHKQMAICGDLTRVFDIGPFFRAENSNTKRHLCEFVCVHGEMELQYHFSELMDLVDDLLMSVFERLNENSVKELDSIRKQYPFQPLKLQEKTLRLSWEEGFQILKEAGMEIDPLADLSTESEKMLGNLVREKYDTDFYMLYGFPSAARPVFTMPDPCRVDYSLSFDVYVRGEEIISGAQRLHIPEMLEVKAKERGINVETISNYIDSFRFGAPPHGGFGMGLERLVMLFCGLNNIRKTSLFPRDPKRLAP